MLRRILKVITWTLVIILLIGLISYVLLYLDIRRRINKTYSVVPEKINIVYDSASVEKGERLTYTRACRECHGQDLGGTTIFDDGMVGTFVSRNITKGKGGLPQDFNESDWVMALKHGLRRDGTPLYLMPSHELSHLSESDMAAVIAYCSTLKPVDKENPPFRIGPLGYILSEFGLIPLLPAEFTDHNLAFATEVKPEISVSYGKYLATICINCHKENMKGGESPVPGGKYIADISSTGNPGKWTHEQFITTLTTGKTPEGKQLNPAEMPWTITKTYSREELTALHMYLQSLK